MQQVADSLPRVLETGESFASWKARVRAGEIPLEVGPLHLETIFRNTIQQSYNRGRYEQQARTVGTHPWYLYDAVDDSRTRPTHAAMDGFVAPHDDPVWTTWTPACGHRCRCRRIALTERQAARYREQDAERMQDAEAAGLRASAQALGPDKGWGYDPYREPNAGLRGAIERRRGQCGGGQLAAGAGNVLCAGRALDDLVARLEPRAVADELRDRLGARVWGRFEAASAAVARARGLPVEQGVALSAYTDRALGRLINATARAMADLADAIPADATLGLWLIRAMDEGLMRLPAVPGAAYRGLSVRAPDPMPEALAARWEDAHRPGRDVQYFGYTSVMTEEGQQYAGDWQLAVYSASARDLSGLSVAGEPELAIPRQTVFRYLGFVGGYRLLQEGPMKGIKPSRQFALPRESSLDDLRRAGATEEALAALLPAVERGARGRAAWEAAGRPGMEAMQRRLERANDLAFAGMPGYARNEALGIFGPAAAEAADGDKTP